MMVTAIAPPPNRHHEYRASVRGAAAVRGGSARSDARDSAAREETDAQTSDDANTLIAEMHDDNQRLMTACVHARQRLEEAEAASRLKDDFLATVAHELRTPLNAVLGWTRLLELQQVPPERVDQAVAAIARSSCALATMVDDLLDTCRILNGRLRMAKEHIDIVGIAQLAVDAVRPSAEAKGVRLRFEGTSDRRVVVGDAGRLQQVIWNLLANAIKFTPKGGSVRVSVERSDDQIEINVIDTGEGISADFLPHVFERYRQADDATTARHTGLGLGLGIVRDLVALHGGSVHAASAGPGKGATFTVRFSAVAAEDGGIR